MGWLQNIFGKTNQPVEVVVPIEEQQKLDDAFEYGRKVAQSMDQEIEQFMRQRFGHVKDAYLKILEGSYHDAKARTDHSPIIIARIDRDLFNENVSGTRDKMREEILSKMETWQSVMAQMGNTGDIERLVDSKLDAFESDMNFAGINLFMEHADELKEADDLWRQVNPEQAKQEPLG